MACSNVPFLPPPPILPSEVGIALVVANDYQDTKKKFLGGTHRDADTMVDAFKFLGYHTILMKNISREEFVTECKRLASYNYSLSNRCRRIAVVFSGHGEIDAEMEREVIIMQDERNVIIEELVNSFKATANGNHTLVNTVRMFFIDACRGDLEEPRIVSRSPRGGQFINQTSTEANILIAYSTTKNHKAYEGQDGGFWIQLLAQEMCTSQESLLIVLTHVNKKLNERCNNRFPKMQTAQVVSQLIEEVYFLKERPIPSHSTQPMAGFTPPTVELLESPNYSVDRVESRELKETLTSRGITCDYNFTETPSRQPGGIPSYSCELSCRSNGMFYKFSSKQLYYTREDAKRDVNEQAKQIPEIGGNEIFSRSAAEDEAEDHTSRVDKLAEYCKSKGYRPPSYNTKFITNGCYVSTVLVPRNGKFEGKEAETIEMAKEKAAKQALLDMRVIVDSLKLL